MVRKIAVNISHTISIGSHVIVLSHVLHIYNVLSLLDPVCVYISIEQFEDTKGVIRSRKSNTDIQCNSQRKKVQKDEQ